MLGDYVSCIPHKSWLTERCDLTFKKDRKKEEKLILVEKVHIQPDL